MESHTGLDYDAVADKAERLTLNWPEKNKLIEDRDIFVRNNIDEEKKFVKKKFPNTGTDRIETLARLALNAKFMLGEMNKISPIPFRTEIKVVVSSGDESHLMNFDFTRDDKKNLTSAEVGINWDELNRMVNRALDPEIKFKDTEEIMDRDGVGFETASERAQVLENERLKDLEPMMMSSAVHEFAHLVYLQQHEQERRGIHIWQNSWFNMMKAFMPADKKFGMYLSLYIEMSAKTWQLNFLKRYFPNSQSFKDVERLMRKGREWRELVEKEGTKILFEKTPE